MGASGTGFYDNDDAADWFADFEASGPSSVDTALSDVAEASADGYIEIDVANAGLAAADVVAIAFGKLAKDTDGEVEASVSDHEDEIQEIDNIVRRAIAAVEAIIADAESSEYVSLWEEAGAWDEASTVVDVLLARLGSIE